jgi:DNA invertase Pin-like site-specific DNA recombinase
MPRYVIYARKSSESEDRQVLSIESQVRELRAIATRENIPVSEVLTETKSAKAPGRPIFNRLMRQVNKGEISGVLCWKMDRLSRNPFDSGVVLQAQADGKLRRIITSDGVRTADSNDRLMGTFELAFATKFIDDLRANTTRGLRERLTRGWAVYLPPIGYLNDVVNKTIVRDPERFPLVRRMWDLLLSGEMRPEQIRKVANDEWGFRTRRLKRSGGRPLGRSSIFRVFGNSFYMGVIALKDGRRYPGAHEPMITREEFDRAQRLLGRPGRARPVRKEFAFTGIMKCGNCEAAITAEEHIKKSGRRYVYYRCTRQRILVEKCREPAISETELVNQLASRFGSLTMPKPVLDWLKHKTERVLTTDGARQETIRKTLSEALSSLGREQENLLSLQLRDLVPVELYEKKSREIEQRKHALTDRLASVDRNNHDLTRQLTELLDFATSVRSAFLQGSPVRRRVILETVGLNYQLKGRKVSFRLETPLNLVAAAGGCSNWYRLVDDLRTWALNTTEYFKVPRFEDSA